MLLRGIYDTSEGVNVPIGGCLLLYKGFYDTLERVKLDIRRVFRTYLYRGSEMYG